MVVAVIMTLTTLSCTNKMKDNNPLLVKSENLYGAPAFDKFKNEHYKAAFEKAILLAKNKIESITDAPQEPTFENTIEALEFAGMELSAVSSIFFNLNEANTDSVMQDIALEVSPMITEYSNDIMLNVKLFEKVKSVYEKRASTNLTKEQIRLTEETYKGFARNGADLKGEARDKYREISTELSKLTLMFGQNVLAATNKFIMNLEDSSLLEGLPQFVIDGAAEEAKQRELNGWVFTLHGPSYGPFMQYSTNRELREKMWRANNSKSFNDEFDNREIIQKIVELRMNRARLLGFTTHAQYVLENNMAGTPDKVNTFIEELLSKTIDPAKKEVAQITKYAKSKGFAGEIMPWDFGYWSEQYKNEKYAINDQMLKPYFRLESVEKAIFSLADSLYGLTFTQNNTIPVYHNDVKVFEVKDASGKFISLLYVDYFPRESKRGGAWMTTFRDQFFYNKVEHRPFVSLVCNFTKPTENTPSLLTFDEFTTLLHEFGHALHGMLAEGNYPSLTGTNVVRDFVELPSQIMENWATESEFLKSFAKHYETGEEIPQEFIKKIIDARNYLGGYSNVRQLTFAMNDMAWHNLSETSSTSDVMEFEKAATQKARVLPFIDSVCMSTSFGHIFSGGYSAGYYSYKWAEVLEADAFSLFKEKGIFNKEVAESFRANILSKGNLEDAAILYRNFRGRDPRPEALIEKFGLDKL
ncbi:MAG: peptidase M3 [Bacteroidetes bacterium GWE2_39_28]|nr:MAG: peptidase M3 [Bacteroidetes bacterium GWE2_39_28]OFY15881.1 MAG: peptidase M3 [Bacteroidetes bacterium GWF2_39_10]OFZ10047.1 MAG: peptidase M3 [Bacteroidetes bacterium RIFOXYC2_FULL_39_11]